MSGKLFQFFFVSIVYFHCIKSSITIEIMNDVDKFVYDFSVRQNFSYTHYNKIYPNINHIKKKTQKFTWKKIEFPNQHWPLKRATYHPFLRLHTRSTSSNEATLRQNTLESTTNKYKNTKLKSNMNSDVKKGANRELLALFGRVADCGDFSHASPSVRKSNYNCSPLNINDRTWPDDAQTFIFKAPPGAPVRSRTWRLRVNNAVRGKSQSNCNYLIAVSDVEASDCNIS